MLSEVLNVDIECSGDGFMTEQWFYFHENKQEGPLSKEQLKLLIAKGSLLPNSYVWTKGFSDWKLLKDVAELAEDIGKQTAERPVPQVQQQATTSAKSVEKMIEPAADRTHSSKAERTQEQKIEQTASFEQTGLATQMNNEIIHPELKLTKLAPDHKSIYIKTGFDRGGTPKEYGPYSLNMLKKLYQTSRINGRTLIYFPGLDCWRILAVFSDFEEIFQDLPPIIQESDRRRWERKPFTARLFFTADNQFFEGVCKDISLGGMLVLLEKFPGKVGDVVKLNVHPENQEHQFVAKAKIVRVAKTDGAISMEFVELSDLAKKSIQNYLINP